MGCYIGSSDGKVYDKLEGYSLVDDISPGYVTVGDPSDGISDEKVSIKLGGSATVETLGA